MSDSSAEKGRTGRRAGSGASLAAFLVLLTASVALAAVQPPREEGRRYIVALRDSVGDPGAVGRAQTERLGGRLGFVYRYGPIGYSATLSDSAVKALREDPLVQTVTPDRINQDGQPAQSPSTGIKRIFAFENKALQIDETANFTVDADVAVIDGGMKAESDLNVFKRTYCNDTGGGAKCKDGEGDDEKDGHGTAVASVVGAKDNAEGVVGVAPSVRLWSVKIFDPGVSESEVVAGINYVTEHASEIEVAILSVECLALPCKRENAAKAITKAVEAGVVVVVAAGNLTADAGGSEYAKHPDVIAVSAIADYDGKPELKAVPWWYPSCNPVKQPKDTEQVGKDDALFIRSNYGEVVDVAAPGVCIRTLAPGGGLTYSTGTSFASPEVAGAAAILAAHSNPNSKKDVETIRATIQTAGNSEWEDTSPDKIKEQLLDLSNEAVFN
jgi:subtilisin family serine protease